MIYLASPYSHPDESVRIARYRAACRFAGAMVKRGLVVFSPIAHSHVIAGMCDIDGDWESWRKQDEAMIDLASGVVVLCLPGWMESRGVQAEIAYAHRRGLEVQYVYPESIGL